jgi:hypothetical protein
MEDFDRSIEDVCGCGRRIKDQRRATHNGIGMSFRSQGDDNTISSAAASAVKFSQSAESVNTLLYFRGIHA